ncbi:hypothetical protein NDU88_005406 [Pleurodeles waltl]|uniref:Uncharacterized protein n=1 Tax=Pleurodeles waltl TaxID=8319 RepID=A0AAV7RIF2_PLEWA|nr:hypothetical protein NDU88_005406 [Pleurodeles waltl]
MDSSGGPVGATVAGTPRPKPQCCRRPHQEGARGPHVSGTDARADPSRGKRPSGQPSARAPRGRARSAHCSLKGAAGTSEPVHPAKAPVRPAPTPAGPRARPPPPHKKSRIGRTPRASPPDRRPRPLTLRTSIQRQSSQGAAGGAAPAGPAPQGRLGSPPCGRSGVTAPASRERLGEVRWGHSSVALPLFLPLFLQPALPLCGTGRVSFCSPRRLNTESTHSAR